jgi:transcriptional regulator with XRE-family HTH domain
VTDVLTGGRTGFPELDRTKSSLERRIEAERQLQIAVDDHSVAVDQRRESIREELEDRTVQRTNTAQAGLLAQISDSGMSWRDVARVLGVSVPAVQKWRKGGEITGVNRYNLARLAAVLDLIADHLVLTRMDLLASNRHDLVLELVSDEASSTTPVAVLDAYDPAWRENLVDRAFEAFEAGDGRMSVRPKR